MSTWKCYVFPDSVRHVNEKIDILTKQRYTLKFCAIKKIESGNHHFVERCFPNSRGFHR